MKTLADCKPGDIVYVKKIHRMDALGRRMMAMGILKGTMVEVCKEAPLKDPIEIRVRGSMVSIRRMDAAIIEVSD